MTEKIKLLNAILTGILFIVSIYLLIQIAFWLPKIYLSEYRLNNAKCLESYKNQDQAPLGACGFDF